MSDEQPSVLVLRRNAQEALKGRHFDEAARLVEALEAEDPHTAHTEGLRLEWLVRTDRAREAAGLAELLVVRHPTSHRILYLAGWAAFKVRDWDKAEERFRESLALRPSDFLRGWLGRVLARQGRFDEAEPILSDLAPRSPECTTELAWIHHRRGDTERAMALLDAHLARQPWDSWAAAQRARFAATTLSPAEVIDQLEVLDALGEELPDSLVEGALSALVEAGRTEEALALVPRVPTHRRVNAAWDAYHAGADALAVRLFCAALPEAALDDKVPRSLEAAARRAGLVEEVLARYRELAPENPEFYGRSRRLSR